jgi:sRNA-binding protein
MPQLMRLTHRTYPRQHLEEAVRYLASQYPACFFVDPHARRPLKQDIEADLLADGVQEEVVTAVQFYIRNFGYQRALQAGVERMDLNGKRAGVVTETEQRMAEKQIREVKEQITQRSNPVAVLNSLHALGQIPDDQLRKLTLPPRPSVMKKKNAATLTRLQTLLATANTVMDTTEDDALRAALAVASLRLLIEEAQKVVSQLEAA